MLASRVRAPLLRSRACVADAFKRLEHLPRPSVTPGLGMVPHAEDVFLSNSSEVRIVNALFGHDVACSKAVYVLLTAAVIYSNSSTRISLLQRPMRREQSG